MPRYYHGLDGLYEIYSFNKIILYIIDENGNKTGNYIEFYSTNEIKNRFDLRGVEHLLQIKGVDRIIRNHRLTNYS